MPKDLIQPTVSAGVMAGMGGGGYLGVATSGLIENALRFDAHVLRT